MTAPHVPARAEFGRLDAPVVIEVIRGCHFEAKPCKRCGRAVSAHRRPKGEPNMPKQIPGECDVLQRQNGCAKCGGNKSAAIHYGAPASYNAFGSGRGSSAAAQVGASLKQTWQQILTAKLEEAGVPRGLERVYATGEVTFPDNRADRDQGNFRVLIEKALGDALEDGGWITRDTWDRYQFGDLAMRVVPGESATRLLLTDVFPELPAFPRSGEQLQIGAE